MRFCFILRTVISTEAERPHDVAADELFRGLYANSLDKDAI